MASLTAAKRLLIAIVLGLGLMTSALHAWGAPGHRRVGALAEELLAKQQHTRAAAQVRAILGPVTLAQAGPWADCVREVSGPDKGFLYTRKDKRSSPCFLFSSDDERHREMENYVRNNWTTCDESPPKGCHTLYHFLDLAIQRDGYRDGLVGTTSYDIVHAINAAVTVLRQPACSGPHPPATPIPAAPGRFSLTCRQALMLLVHLVGDLHQPLHVGALYLDAAGDRVDPDSFTGDAAQVRARVRETETHGANWLVWGPRGDHQPNLHSDWDDAPGGATAHAVPATPGPVGGWPGRWATDSLLHARPAFEGVSFAAKDKGRWVVTFQNKASYDSARQIVQRERIETAGARLAQLLVAIWPD